MPRLFALDQNFPEPIVEALAEHLADDADLVPVRRIDSRLTTVDDWEILRALHVDTRPWDGLITTDRHMLGLPKELAVLCQTKLSLVVAEAVGHDPIRATGLVLAHLGSICHDTNPDRAQVWTLRTVKKSPENPWDYMTRAAEQQQVAAEVLYKRERLRKADL